MTQARTQSKYSVRVYLYISVIVDRNLHVRGDGSSDRFGRPSSLDFHDFTFFDL
jgi:hypothetical protein